jgi:Helix-turn-helix domain
MLRRGQITTFQERLDISERAAAGQSDPEIAMALGCSVWTVRKWRRRGQHQGRTGLDARRAMLNQHIPSCVFQGHAPLEAYPRAAHSGRSYRPEWEAEMLDLDRVFQYLANCRWFRRVRANGRLDLGGYDYYLGTTWRNQMLEVRFDATHGCFLGQPAGSDITLMIAPQGLTKTELMGELGHLLALPVYQLALPFTHEAWRQLEYTHALAGTTS